MSTAETENWVGDQDVIERCLIHWLPELSPSKRCDIAASILGNLSVGSHLKSAERRLQQVAKILEEYHLNRKIIGISGSRSQSGQLHALRRKALAQISQAVFHPKDAPP